MPDESVVPGPLQFRCPRCGSPMVRQTRYRGGTASLWEDYPVSSSGTASVYMYSQEEIYVCTNPQCGQSLLRPNQ